LSRKSPSHGESAEPQESQPAPQGRAAEAAARVAARYAKAPSYGEMLACEARAAVHAAEAASKAVQEAQAAFQYVLDGLEATEPAEPAWEREMQLEGKCERAAAPVALQTPQGAPQKAPQKPAEQTRIHLELSRSQPESAVAPAIAPSWELESDALRDEADRNESLSGCDSPTTAEVHDAGPVQPGNSDIIGADVIEPIEPIHANLIEFPREMIATRRARPRRAEGPLAVVESAPQLSIFEVEPDAISILPPAATVDAPASPAWMRSEWPAMTLETQPPSTILDALTQEELLNEPTPQPAPAPEIELAPFSRRLLAIVVDYALIAAAVIAAATLTAPRISELPGLRAIEFGAVLALLAAGTAYYAGFLTLTRATPGMRYAGIELNTFSGFRTTRAQRCRRLLAMLLSVLPLGLGVVWALFDEGQLTWHDRLSKTYLRKR
jgi:uncharacterized RDD family membrane protein YckC